jgi:hypothetical protein
MRIPMEAAMRAGPRGHPRRAIDLGVVHVQTGGQTARGNGLAQAVQKRIQALVGIELPVRNEPAGVVQRGLQEHLPLTAAGPLHPGTEHQVGLPDLIGVLSFVLLVRRGGGFVLEQLAFGESTGAQEAIEGGGRQVGRWLVAALSFQGQMIE